MNWKKNIIALILILSVILVMCFIACTQPSVKYEETKNGSSQGAGTYILQPNEIFVDLRIDQNVLYIVSRDVSGYKYYVRSVGYLQNHDKAIIIQSVKDSKSSLKFNGIDN